jgi:hypothetical protein
VQCFWVAHYRPLLLHPAGEPSAQHPSLTICFSRSFAAGCAFSWRNITICPTF